MGDSDKIKEFLSSSEMDNIMKMFSSMDPAMIFSLFNGMKDSLTEEQQKTIDTLIKSMAQSMSQGNYKTKQ